MFARGIGFQPVAGKTTGWKPIPRTGKRLRIHLVRHLEPALARVVDVGNARRGDGVGDAVLLGNPAGVDQTPGRFGIAQGKAEIEARPRRWLDLREDVLP